MERKLVSIKKIRKLMPIPGADFIEIAVVDDWTVIVKKGEFNVNDCCVFYEIDCLLPVEQRYSFLEKSKKDYDGVPKYRIKTMKMRGVISQGLALPLSSFPEHFAQDDNGSWQHTFKKTFLETNEEVTDMLHVEKYDPELYNNGSVPGQKQGSGQRSFPSFIPKTDQERIQNLPHYYEIYKDHEWEETLKLDGSSLTVYKTHKNLSLWEKFIQLFRATDLSTRVGVCSRNLEFSNGNSSFQSIIMDLGIDKLLPKGYAIQGELIGPKIQANHEKVTANEFHIFDVYDITARKYLLPVDRIKWLWLHNLNDLSHVRITAYVKIFSECETLADLQKRVTGQSLNKGTVSEGRVYKSCTIPGLSFKCISNEYLLKSEK